MIIWRKSSFSDGQGQCLEVADLGSSVAVRNSTRPAAGALTLDRAAMAAFVAACRVGELDDLGVE